MNKILLIFLQLVKLSIKAKVLVSLINSIIMNKMYYFVMRSRVDMQN